MNRAAFLDDACNNLLKVGKSYFTTSHTTWGCVCSEEQNVRGWERAAAANAIHLFWQCPYASSFPPYAFSSNANNFKTDETHFSESGGWKLTSQGTLASSTQKLHWFLAADSPEPFWRICSDMTFKWQKTRRYWEGGNRKKCLLLFSIFLMLP